MPPDGEQPARCAEPPVGLTGVKKGKKRNEKTKRNDQDGVGNGTRMEMDRMKEGEGMWVIMRLK